VQRCMALRRGVEGLNSGSLTEGKEVENAPTPVLPAS
jgi:hypothetical protein